MRESKSGARKENISWTRKLLNFFLHLFFLDVDPLIWTCRQRPLQEEDVYQDPKMATKSVHDHFAPAWNHQLQQQEPDLSLAVLFSEVNALIVTALLYAATQVFALAGPLLLLQIVAGLQCQTCEKATLYYYCIGLFLSPLFQSLSENHMNFMLARMGTRMRNSLMAAIYRKCLRLSNSSLQAEGLGKIVTLMSNDAQKLQDASIVVHNLWGAPLLIVVVLIFLYFEIGLATLICLGLVLIIVPLIFILVKQMVYLRIELLGWTSKRVGLMSEIISGMQMIKFCVWEGEICCTLLSYALHHSTLIIPFLCLQILSNERQ